MDKKESTIFDDNNENLSISWNDDENKIKINVFEPKLVKSTFKSHYVYEIEVKEKDFDYKIKRRFKEIYWMWEKLLSMYVGVFIPKPHFKEKNTTPTFWKERILYLKLFFEYIVERPFLYFSEIFQLFVKSHAHNLQKLFKSYKRLNIVDLYKYNKAVFKNYFEESYLNQLTYEKQDNSSLVIHKKIQENISYFEKFRTKIINFIVLYENNPFLNNKINILKFISLNNKQKKDKLDKIIDELGNTDFKFLKLMLRKIAFLIEDFKSFLLLYEEIKFLKNKYKNSNKQYLDYKIKIEKTGKKNLKDTKEWEKNINNKEKELKLLENLQIVIFERIIKEEVPILKKFKEKKFLSIMKSFFFNRKKLIDLELNILQENI